MPLHSSLLKYIDAVARFGTIRAAARRLNVSSSSINRQILALEAEYGIRLFERVNNGVRLTAAGELLIDHVRRTNRAFEQMLDKITGMKGLKSGHVVVATVPSLATTMVTSLVIDFKKSYPGITIDVRTVSSEIILELLAKEGFDVGFTFNPPSNYALRKYNLADIEIGCVMPPDHALANRSPLLLRDCLDFDLILPSTRLTTRTIIDECLARAGVQPRIYAEADSLAFIKGLVIGGAGIAFQSNLALEPELSQKRLVFRQVQDAGFGSDRLVLVTSMREQTLASTVFLEYACDRLKGHLDGADSECPPPDISPLTRGAGDADRASPSAQFDATAHHEPGAISLAAVHAKSPRPNPFARARGGGEGLGKPHRTRVPEAARKN